MAPSKEFAKKNLVIVALITWSTEVWTKINEGNQKKKKKQEVMERHLTTHRIRKLVIPQD